MPNLRDKILKVTDGLLQKVGRSGVSTRAIAKAAGCSIGALYKHFDSLDDVLLELFKQKIPAFHGLNQLPLRVGERTVAQNLTEVLSTGLGFFRAAMPIWLALLSDRPLRKTYNQRVEGEGRGPHLAAEAIATYLRAEQRLGRVNVAADVKTAATLFLSSMSQRCVFEQFFLERPGTSAEDLLWARATSAQIVRGLAHQLRVPQ
jgi:AcrR family transcriptional regulator